MRADDWLRARVGERLAGIERDGLRRELRSPSGIDLSSNDYLGLAEHPLIKERMARAVEQWGAGSTGSRLLRGHRDAFAAVEERFARFKGTGRALYFSSGYLANIAVLTTFGEEGDTLYCDELNHASLIDGARLSRARRMVYPHLQVPEAFEPRSFVVTESLFSMDGDRARPVNGAPAIVDEAHAIGVYGAGLMPEAWLSINPAGKALGVAGAFVAGPAWAIEYLVQRARPFIFSTAPPPAIAAAIDAALDVIEAEPERAVRVRKLAAFLREKLGMTGDSPIVPVLIGDNQQAVAVAAALQGDGFDVRAIRPPTVPEGTARLRISVNARLSEAVLDRFAAKLEQALCVATS